MQLSNELGHMIMLPNGDIRPASRLHGESCDTSDSGPPASGPTARNRWKLHAPVLGRVLPMTAASSPGEAFPRRSLRPQAHNQQDTDCSPVEMQHQCDTALGTSLLLQPAPNPDAPSGMFSEQKAARGGRSLTLDRSFTQARAWIGRLSFKRAQGSAGADESLLVQHAMQPRAWSSRDAETGDGETATSSRASVDAHDAALHGVGATPTTVRSRANPQELKSAKSTTPEPQQQQRLAAASAVSAADEQAQDQSKEFAAAETRPPAFSLLGNIMRACRVPTGASSVHAAPIALKSTGASANLVKSLAAVQAAVNVARMAASRTDHHRLSLKVMCGAGQMCLYHCGGSVAACTDALHTDKLARWEFFLGDSAHAPTHNAAGQRQPMSQIAAIEDLALAGEVLVSSEMLSAVGDSATAEKLPGGAARLTSISVRPTIYHSQPPAPVEQYPSHVAARAAALFRMHVIDNVRQRIEAGHYDFINETRQLTILFMGFPSLSSPDAALAHQMKPVQDIVMTVNHVMQQFQGTFVQFRCDEKGFLAICAFGLPGVSHANNPERGILAALQMQSLVQGLGQRFACGVTTGALLCACVGSKVRSEYTMFGDAINLAARLMCKAKAGLGPIITDEPTAEKADTKARYETLPPLTLKGKAEATKVRTMPSGPLDHKPV